MKIVLEGYGRGQRESFEKQIKALGNKVPVELGVQRDRKGRECMVWNVKLKGMK